MADRTYPVTDLAQRLAALGQAPPGLNGRGPGRHQRAGQEPSTLRAGERGGNQRSRLDWGLVRAWRRQAADLLTEELTSRDVVTEQQRAELGREIVVRLLEAHNDDLQRAGVAPMPAGLLRAYTKAVIDSLPPGLGRMQELVDDPDIESIEINGHDNVRIVYADGTTAAGDPVADTDEELIADLQFIAAHASTAERPFSPASWALHLTLPGGARLAATAWTSHHPQVVIRRHRLLNVTLDDLVALGTMTPDCAQFLRAAVHANFSIVVSGAQGHGKTTLVRALLAAIDPDERYGTIETEYELYAHRLPGRQGNVAAWEARPGSGERNTDGSMAGEVDLDDLIYSALRMNLARIIVGEVRGKEVLAMFKAMQVGPGSISTLHARHARAVVERLVSLAVEAGNHVETFAYRQIAEHIDLIAHVTMNDDGPAGARRRFVSEILLVEPGEHGRPALTDVYKPGPDGRGTYVGCPVDVLDDLYAAGLPRTFARESGWGS